jgi:hypothetical protein
MHMFLSLIECKKYSCPIMCQAGTKGEAEVHIYLYLTLVLEWGGGQCHAPATLPLEIQKDGSS